MICNECETVAHCTKHGCVPKQSAMTHTKDEAMTLALEALEQIASAMPFPVGRKAITAIKQALAAPVQDEDLYDLAVKADNGGQP